MLHDPWVSWGIAQLAELRPVKPAVPGSNPGSSAIYESTNYEFYEIRDSTISRSI